MSSITDKPAWKALQAHHKQTTGRTIKELFDADAARADSFNIEACGLLLDYSKNPLTTDTLDLLCNLADAAGMKNAIAAMFAGQEINVTEHRPALHVALRSPDQDSRQEKLVHATLQRMADFVNAVTGWQWKGCKGEPITDVVNIGIGGSDLGPAMVYQALSDLHLDGIRVHFVSNVDPVDLEQALVELDPATTLFVIASKSFATLETSRNAEAARRWFLGSGAAQQDMSRHFVAVTANTEKALAFGITDSGIFPIWDWVGGRFSLWSAIGLPVALGIGMDNFRRLLTGAHAMDSHFRTAPTRENLPVMLALLDTWVLNFRGATSRAMLPYSQQLQLLPAWLQQLEMESLGKSVTTAGQAIAVDTGTVVWGSAGTNGQHSFHQLLHQGTAAVAADFIAVAKTNSADTDSHRQLLANCFAQSQALMNGKSLDSATNELVNQGLSKVDATALAPHKVVPGNRPSNTILIQELTPETLGALLAAYEHKVYARSVILGINAFDQFGVELGKALSTDIYAALNEPKETTSFDASTNLLINRSKSIKTNTPD